MCVPLKALFLVSIISNTEINIYFFKYTNLTLIVLVIGKAQFRRAMLSCDSSCYYMYMLGGNPGNFCTEMFP